MRLLALLGTLALLTNAAEVTYNFNVAYTYGAPDGQMRPMITVNGQFPGPTIDVTEGDTVVVTVNNMLATSGTSVHFHGIHQRGTPFYDGAVGVTQCPINPMESFTYRFTADLPGTYYWHAHNGGQRADGFVGPMIVRPKAAYPFQFDAELPPLLLDDWWHTPSELLLAGLFNITFAWVGDPKSILLNGRAQCPAGVTTCDPNLAGYYSYNVQQGKTYLLRVISGSALMYLNLALEGHTFTVVEADGMYVQPWQTAALDINSGQRYAVLFTANLPTSGQNDYWFTAETRYRNLIKGQAILRYAGGTANPPTAIPTNPATVIASTATTPSVPTAYTNLNLIPQGNLRALNPTTLPSPTRTLILLGTQERINGYLIWTINHASFAMPSTPILQDMYSDGKYSPSRVGSAGNAYFTPDTATTVKQAFVMPLAANEVVDIVIQNKPALNGVSEQHPWHIHGHSVWDLGFGIGTYDTSASYPQLNLVDPPLRDTVTVYPHGWTKFRLRADNPGAWLLHCHIIWHEVLGMMMAFVEGGMLPALPPNFPTCGEADRRFCPAKTSVTFNNNCRP
eukprot:TRINITY_DN25424_c0_g1_i1.p2 TRINITY_DN25424_c0_g1~~TRINITY_DN25424_c0_g1_i1.p2  ORF type:complete len:566 (-),score=100.28 TRINITY_DN25424_c0_g1_i1:253-1950(-)